MKYKINFTAALVPCFMAIILTTFIGCSEKIISDVENSGIKVSITSKLSEGQLSELIEVFRLTVDAEDFTAPVVVPLELAGSFLVGEVAVPAGANRQFMVQAFDAAEELIYQGESFADVVYNTTITVDIDLLPVVPLLRVIPRSLSIDMDESFAVRVSAYNILDIRSAEFDLSFGSKDLLVNLDSVIIGPGLPADSRLSYVGTVSITSVWIDRTDPSGLLVDASGNAHLAVFYFTTHSETNLDIDTAFIEIIPTTFDRGSVDLFDPYPLDSIYLERSVIELIKVAGI